MHDEEDDEAVDEEGEKNGDQRMKTTDTDSGTMMPTAGDSTRAIQLPSDEEDEAGKWNSSTAECL